MCPLECLFFFSFWIPLYLLLHQNEVMNVLDQLKENNKREVELRGKRKEKKVEEIKLQRIGKDAFKTIEAIYIELLTSRPPLVF